MIAAERRAFWAWCRREGGATDHACSPPERLDMGRSSWEESKRKRLAQVFDGERTRGAPVGAGRIDLRDAFGGARFQVAQPAHEAAGVIDARFGFSGARLGPAGGSVTAKWIVVEWARPDAPLSRVWHRVVHWDCG